MWHVKAFWTKKSRAKLTRPKKVATVKAFLFGFDLLDNSVSIGKNSQKTM